ncbi:MAG TPA: RHS repeat domain-containing protein [Pyrinomonadaceae bacterium]|nr:RHS repeat domain-containing protein [Pyrinomonadaceae bacterium]
MKRPMIMHGLAYPRVDLTLSKQQNKRPNGLLGRVKSLRLEHSLEQPPGELFRLVSGCAFDLDGNLIQEVRFNAADVHRSRHSYDSNGRKTRLISSNGRAWWKTRYSYFDEENRIEVIDRTGSRSHYCSNKYIALYDTNGKQIEASYSDETQYSAHVLYQYTPDNNKRISKLITLNDDGDQQHEIEYHYDAEGQLVAELALYPLLGLYKKTSFTRGDGFQITETLNYDRTGSVEFRLLESSDVSGNLLEVFYWDVKAAQESKAYRHYEFDSTGNWTKQLVYNSDPQSKASTTVLIERRALEYY